ncbi:MAG: Rossmann-like and DUF2520 domain-containing protein [Thermodesulfobacteriota bacterium]|nr:Rossmann-like and DUF2520 domain-containing protein [Thermodesulfobacteriota bacterium]
MKDSIAILGMGKVGTAVGNLLRSAGYRIVAVASRSDESAEKGAKYTGGTIYDSLTSAASRAECIFITTGDDAIASVCEKISKGGGVGAGKKVVHMSGAGGLDLLESACRAGARIASMHPIQSFADVEGALKNIPGSAFGVTAEEEIKDWAVQIVRDLGGVPCFVSDADRSLYHAAACMASNYLVVLMYMVEEVYGIVGLDRERAVKAFWPLVTGTINNIENQGTVQSLTGPISRGDIGTVKKHIQAFHDRLPEFLDVYRIMGGFASDIGLKNKTLTRERAEELKSLLLGGGSGDE